MLLEATQLHKRFGPFTALHEVSLALRAGEVVGFLGPNGAGKSTTMKILAGALSMSAGGARIAGLDLAAQPLECRRRVGYLPQELPLYRDMRVEAYLDHVARLKGIAPSSRRREVVEAMERADLMAVARRHIAKLSGGNRQRVGLAQALIGTPPLLILDEATAGLDPAQVANFRELIRSLRDRHGILLSTHIMAEVEACCDRVVIVHQGRTLLDGTVADMRARADARPRLRLRLRSDGLPSLVDRLAETGWAESVVFEGQSLLLVLPEERRGELIALAEAHGGLRELVEERRSLEEVFRDLVAPAAKA